jgi:hypothetical protein
MKTTETIKVEVNGKIYTVNKAEWDFCEARYSAFDYHAIKFPKVKRYLQNILKSMLPTYGKIEINEIIDKHF